jgi:hypothetical protein
VQQNDGASSERPVTGWLLGAGFDLAILRKIFGKVTGISAAAKTTQGS